jgi:hypothetical protein
VCTRLNGDTDDEYELKAATKTSDRMGAKVPEHNRMTQHHVRAVQSKSPTRATDRKGQGHQQAGQRGAYVQRGPQWRRVR